MDENSLGEDSLGENSLGEDSISRLKGMVMVTGTKFEEINACDNINAKIHRGHRMLKLPKSPFIKSVALFFCFTVWANESLKHLYYQT